MDVRVGPLRRLSTEELMLSNCGSAEDSSESLGQQGDQTSQTQRKSTLNIHWKDWCWSSNTLATWCEESIHWKRSWCWDRLKAGGEGDNRGWNGWMASLTQWTWIWTKSRRWWRQGSLACSPWGCKESNTTEWLNNNNWGIVDQINLLRLSAPGGEGLVLQRPGQILVTMNPQLLDGRLGKLQRWGGKTFQVEREW